jgi:hypothetical protein
LLAGPNFLEYNISTAAFGILRKCKRDFLLLLLLTHEPHDASISRLEAYFGGSGSAAIPLCSKQRLTFMHESAVPKVSFVACNPTFEQASMKVTLDAVDQAILTYEALGPSNPINGSTDLLAIYTEDNITTVSAGFGSAFLLRTLFESENPPQMDYSNLDLFSDVSSYVATKVLKNKSSLADGNNLLLSVEKVFPVRIVPVQMMTIRVTQTSLAVG